MFNKIKCPSCGAKNPKERMTCTECGAPLVLENIVRQQAKVQPKAEHNLLSRLRAFSSTFTEEAEESQEPTEEGPSFVEHTKLNFGEGIETLKHTPGICPYCSSTSISEYKVEGPLSEGAQKIHGYSYRWRCDCKDCRKRWFRIT